MSKLSRMVVVRGPLTDRDVREIVEAVQRIEGRRPEETFTVAVDAPDHDGEIQELLDKINPLRTGYERMVKYRNRG